MSSHRVRLIGNAQTITNRICWTFCQVQGQALLPGAAYMLALQAVLHIANGTSAAEDIMLVTAVSIQSPLVISTAEGVHMEVRVGGAQHLLAVTSRTSAHPQQERAHVVGNGSQVSPSDSRGWPSSQKPAQNHVLRVLGTHTGSHSPASVTGTSQVRHTARHPVCPGSAHRQPG